MLTYALSTLRERKSAFIGTFVALFAAAALVTACGMMLETGLRGTIHTERYAGAPIVVAGDQNVHETEIKEKSDKPDKVKQKSKALFQRVWLPSETVSLVESVPGVESAVAEVNFPAHLVTADGSVLSGPEGTASWGHSWESAQLTPFSIIDGAEPDSAKEVVVDEALADRSGVDVGDSVTVQSTGMPAEYEVSGIAAAQNGELTEQSALFFSAEEAEWLAGRDDQVAVIGVFPESGTDVAQLHSDIDVALADTSAQVHSGYDRGPVEFLDASQARLQMISMGGAMAGMAVLVSILVVTGTFALSIQQRYRELALVRAVAAAPKQLRRLIGVEAVIVGVAGGLVGSVVGIPLGSWLYTQMVGMGAMPSTLEVVVSPFPVFAAALLTTAGALVAARISARRTAQIRPAEAMAEAAVPQRLIGPVRLLAGLVFLAGGIVLLVVLSSLRLEQAATPVTFGAVVVLASAVWLLSPIIGLLAAVLFALPMRFFRVSGHLAVANSRANAARLGAVIAPLSLMIAMAGTVLFVETTLSGAAQQEATEGNNGDLVVVSQGSGVPASAAEDLRERGDIESVTEIQHTTVRVGLENYQVQGATAARMAEAIDMDVVSGSVEDFGSGDIAVSELSADRLGMAVGDALDLTMGDGTELTLTVAAVYNRGLGFGDLTMDHDVVSSHVDNPLSSSAVVRLAEDADPASVEDVVSSYPGMQVVSSDAANEMRAEVAQANAEVNYLTLGLVVAFTAIAVVNTLAMSTAQRFREFALLRLVGGTRRQVRRMLRLETVIVALTAAVIGSAIALAVLTTFASGMTGVARPHISPSLGAAVLVVATLLALVSAMIPGRFAMSARPERSINESE